MGTEPTFSQPASRGIKAFLCIALLLLALSIAAVIVLAVTLREQVNKNDDKLPMMGQEPGCDDKEAPCPEVLDVAVVGAGASGSYSAWKLSEKHPDWKIHVFDANNRAGGRLYSVKVPGISDFIADMGSMRFKKKHTHLIKLIKELGLETQNFTTPVSTDTLYYFKENMYSQSDLDAGITPFHMTPEEKNRIGDTDALMAYWNTMILDKSSLNETDMWKRMTNDGSMAYEKGIASAYEEVASTGAIDYVAYKSQFPGDFDLNINYADWSDPVSSPYDLEADRRYAITKGFQELVNEMIARTLQHSRNRLHLNRKLVSVEYMDGVAHLLFYDSAAKKYMTVCAKRVVLGVSSEALSRIELHDNDLHMKISPLLDIVQRGVAMKTYLAYNRPWWRTDGQGKKFEDLRNQGIDLKFIVTDNPMGTILDIGVDQTTGKALLLSYTDSNKHVNFWEAYQQSGAEHNSHIPTDFKVTKNLVNQMNIQLSRIFNISLDTLPQPYAAVSQAWHLGPYYTAWHVMAAGYNYPAIYNQMIKPVSTKDFFIIGEAFSDVQGWTEGALRTAATMLENHF